MKKLMLLLCLMLATVGAQAQFEKGKWTFNTSVTGLNFLYNTDEKDASFGLGAKGGAFLADNVALLVGLGAQWQPGPDFYTASVGARYYFDRIGVYLGAEANLKSYSGEHIDYTRVGFGAEVGYAFFLSRSVTLEPAVYCDVNKDRALVGLKLGFGIYF